MKNLFYCLSEGIIRQGRIKYIVSGSSVHSTIGVFSSVVVGKRYSIQNYGFKGELAGIDRAVSHSDDIVYPTIEDCKNGVNGLVFKEFVRRYLHDIFDNGIKIGNCPYGITPEVIIMNGGESPQYVIGLPYWSWNGVKAVKKYASGWQYNLLSGNFTINKEIDENVYLSEEECIADNVVKIVCFADEEL